MNDVFVGIGSNMNDPLMQCRKAVDHLQQFGETQLMAMSPWFQTEPFGGVTQDWFVNGIVLLRTRMEPMEFLKACQILEQLAGRVRDVTWGPRILDLDILLWRNRIRISKQLTIPHPWLHMRRFVLAPMCTIAPNELHPLTGYTMKKHLDCLTDSLIVRPIPGNSGDKP
ncbi:2-amino-4-hydroxy-6-hydroxymethyldihydropteridine diphosphokinase [bacterium]|nr:2-amino-4-hydroxy-6-hydroxymethyldihydropteridine diphosphokinase [candidate division CSSED10-310 bacterium]